MLSMSWAVWSFREQHPGTRRSTCLVCSHVASWTMKLYSYSYCRSWNLLERFNRNSYPNFPLSGRREDLTCLHLQCDLGTRLVHSFLFAVHLFFRWSTYCALEFLCIIFWFTQSLNVATIWWLLRWRTSVGAWGISFLAYLAHFKVCCKTPPSSPPLRYSLGRSTASRSELRRDHYEAACLQAD